MKTAVPAGMELIKSTNKAACKKEIERGLANADKFVLVRLENSSNAKPYMQMRHAKVTGMTIGQAKNVWYQNEKGERKQYGDKDYKWDVEHNYIGTCRPYSTAAEFAVASRSIELPAGTACSAYIQAWKERPGLPARKKGQPNIKHSAVDYDLVESAMFFNKSFKEQHKEALLDIYEDFCLLATLDRDGPGAARSFAETALSHIESGDEPLSRTEALRRFDAGLWIESEIEELRSMKRLEVFNIVHRGAVPRGKKIIKQKWVYKQKPDRKKARLVAKGFMQSPWDIGETYAPVTRLSTVRTLLAIAAGRPEWSLRHLDISTAFINADLKEDVYMELPDGYRACEHCHEVQPLANHTCCNSTCKKTMKRDADLVIKLRKAIYGLKQSPRDWFDTITGWLMKPLKNGGQGFKQSPHDPCLISNLMSSDPEFAKAMQAKRAESSDQPEPTLISKVKNGKEIWIALYVDDLLIAGDSELIEPFVAAISKQYTIRDLGVPSTFLGCEIKRAADRKSIVLSCSTYINAMAKKFGLTKTTGVSTPLVPGTKLTTEDQSTKGNSRVDSTMYRSYVGSLLYAAMTCRPDIAYAVKELSRFLVEPLKAHLSAAQHVVEYLFHTHSLGIKYSKQESDKVARFSVKALWNDHRPNEIAGYSDADWAGQVPGCKSTSGYVFMINGGAVSWKSQTQPVVALSSAEAEYVAVSEATKEALYLKKLIAELRHLEPQTVTVFEDNIAAEAWTRNDTDHGKSRHIDVRYHHIRDHVKKGDIKIVMCPTAEMVADIMTKGLNPDLHFRTTMRMMGHAPCMARPGQAKQPMPVPVEETQQPQKQDAAPSEDQQAPLKVPAAAPASKASRRLRRPSSARLAIACLAELW